MSFSRRALFGGLVAIIAAPAIIRTPGLLMPIKPLYPSSDFLWLEHATGRERVPLDGDLFNDMARAMFRPKVLRPGSRFVMSRNARAMLDVQAIRERHTLIVYTGPAGDYLPETFHGIPLEVAA